MVFILWSIFLRCRCSWALERCDTILCRENQAMIMCGSEHCIFIPAVVLLAFLIETNILFINQWSQCTRILGIAKNQPATITDQQLQRNIRKVAKYRNYTDFPQRLKTIQCIFGIYSDGIGSETFEKLRYFICVYFSNFLIAKLIELNPPPLAMDRATRFAVIIIPQEYEKKMNRWNCAWKKSGKMCVHVFFR